MADQMSPSEALYARACRVLPGGVSRNTVFRRPHPYYAQHGSGCRVFDVEGVERLDFANNMASLIHGHAHPEIVAAVSAQLQRGTAFTLATEAEVSYAELLCGRAPGFDQIRFVNSGTEAVMGSLKAARAFTGRPKIAKIEGSYHGGYDYAEVSQTAAPANWGDPDRPTSVPVAVGTPVGALEDVVVLPFNDPKRAVKILDAHAGEIACVLIDPLPHRVGLVPADPEFVRALHAWTRADNALLIFDEVITFRTEFGGAQQRYAIEPDITALGKIIGGGFPAGAFAGRQEVMSVLDPSAEKLLLPHSGTFSANPITMTAGETAMALFDESAVARLNRLGELARKQIREVIALIDLPASVSGAGSLFRIHLTPEPPANYRAAYCDKHQAELVTRLVDDLYEHGIMLINTCSGALSTAMDESHIERLSEALMHGFRKLKPAVEKQNRSGVLK